MKMEIMVIPKVRKEGEHSVIYYLGSQYWKLTVLVWFGLVPLGCRFGFNQNRAFVEWIQHICMHICVNRTAIQIKEKPRSTIKATSTIPKSDTWPVRFYIQPKMRSQKRT